MVGKRAIGVYVDRLCNPDKQNQSDAQKGRCLEGPFPEIMLEVG